jgi:hypothetical protein
VEIGVRFPVGAWKQRECDVRECGMGGVPHSEIRIPHSEGCEGRRGTRGHSSVLRTPRVLSGFALTCRVREEVLRA